MKTINHHFLVNVLVHATVVFIFLWVFLWIFGCGKDDQRNEQCALFGCESSPTPEPTSPPTKPTRTDITPQDGKDGKNGTSCTTETTQDGAVIICDDGTSSTIYNGQTGATGDKGDKGDVGETGSSGKSCTVETTPDGAVISCEDGSSSVITNGTNGSTIIPIVPCPSKPGSFPEILLCIDSKLFKVYGSTTKIRYVQLIPGTYTTSDGRSCNFIVIQNCQISY